MPKPTRSSATVVQIVVNPGGRGALLEFRAPRGTGTGNGAFAPSVKSTTLTSLYVVIQPLSTTATHSYDACTRSTETGDPVGTRPTPSPRASPTRSGGSRRA